MTCLSSLIDQRLELWHSSKKLEVWVVSGISAVLGQDAYGLAEVR